MSTLDTPTESDALSNAAPNKDVFFERLAAISDDMIRAYGADFAMGALILAARYIAEGRQIQNDA